MPARLLATLVAVLAFAGPASAASYFDVAKLPAPPVEGKEIADNVEEFVGRFPSRVGGTPNEIAAAALLHSEAEKLGYATETVSIPVVNGDPGTIGRAVIASRKGLTQPNEHLLVMGHYDVVPQTIEGAYDNGSGTNMIRALAKSMATVPTNRSVSFIWYSNEEQGLLASEAHAKQWYAEQRGIVRAVLGFDMVGIAYPVAAPKAGTTCLCLWHGEDDEDLEALVRHVNFGVLGFPEQEGLVEFRGVNARNSDERSWDAEGARVLRWAGMPTAATYPAYHRPDDTMEKIDEVAGGRQFFEAGLRNTLVSAYTTALMLDNEMPVAKATATVSGATVTFDGSGSNDPDGPVSRFAWDFGDGATGVGATASHAYAKPGTYTARLTVGDNLWTPVTHSVEVPVTVTRGTAAPAVKKKKKKASCRKPRKRASAKQKRAYKRCVAKARTKAKKRPRGR